MEHLPEPHSGKVNERYLQHPATGSFGVESEGEITRWDTFAAHCSRFRGSRVAGTEVITEVIAASGLFPGRLPKALVACAPRGSVRKESRRKDAVPPTAAKNHGDGTDRHRQTAEGRAAGSQEGRALVA
jgi:hypothetical protein